MKNKKVPVSWDAMAKVTEEIRKERPNNLQAKRASSVLKKTSDTIDQIQ